MESEEQPSAASKKRKLQLDSLQCQNRMSSPEGAVPLTNPQNHSHRVRTTDSNRGLYPRKKKKRKKSNNSNSSDEESSARVPLDRVTELGNPAQLDNSKNSKSYPSCSGFQQASKVFSDPSASSSSSGTFLPRPDATPKNTLTNYFQKSVSDHSEAASSQPGLDNKFRPQLDDSSPEVVYESLASIISSAHVKTQDENYHQSDDEDDDDENECTSFGLFGLGGENCKSDDSCKFDQLPDEIVEIIFCHLPLQDLLLNATFVCTRWHQIISNKNFIPWKKLYYKLKASDNPVSDGHLIIPELIGINQIDTSLLTIFKIVNKLKRKAPADMENNLTQLEGYPGAKSLVEKTCSTLDEKNLSPWCLVAAFAILSETVADITVMISQLSRSQCYTYDFLECLYCVATVLFCIDCNHSVGKGMLYRTVYAIYLYENEWTANIRDITAVQESTSGQQSIYRYGFGKVRLTHEQMKIVNHRQSPNEIVKIVAFAGTGKTTTLVEYTKLRLHQRFLLIVFNRSVCDQAKKQFPGNVECRTAHSLAYSEEGFKYRHKIIPKLHPKTLDPLMERGPANINKRQRYARNVLTSVESYINSADELLTLRHVPEYFFKIDGEREYFTDQERLDILFDAEQIWNRMKKINDFEVKMLHDGYLKLHQLNKPVYEGYNCILVDEAQDCNPTMLDIILSQNCSKILVGDPNQQIYAFRGAIDALKNVQSSKIYYLTQSFRFGPEIAYVANLLLNVLKSVKKKTLVGGKQKADVMGGRIGQLAVLSRSNGTLFKKAVNMVCRGVRHPGEPTDIRGHYIGGTHPLKQLIDIYNLMKKGRGEICVSPIKDKFIGIFQSFAALKAYATYSEDVELVAKIQLVEVYTERIPEYVEKIIDKCSYSLKNANVIFTTVHKAKGLEFDTVMLTDDFSINTFPYNPIEGVQLSTLQENEWNILYVAVTRAKKCLLLSPALYYIILGAQEKFEFPVLKSKFEEIPKCCMPQCINECQSSSSFLMVRRQITLAEGNSTPSGPLCSDCSLNDIYIEFTIRHPGLASIMFYDQEHLTLEDNQHVFTKFIYE